MLTAIELDPTEDKPKVIFNFEQGTFLLEGRSMPENANSFYDPLEESMKEYVKAPSKKTEFVFRLDYFNSSSNSKLVKLLICLEDIKDKDECVEVVWHYHEDDDLMKTRGEEMASIIELPFRLVSFN